MDFIILHLTISFCIFNMFQINFLPTGSDKLLNLNLPENQCHNFHLLEDQNLYFEEEYSSLKKNDLFVNGTAIPFYLSTTGVFPLCFYFVNYLWSGILHSEVIGSGSNECLVGNPDFGWSNFFVYLFYSIWIIFLWFENIRFESNEGYHISKVNTDYTIGFVLFLLSEVMFFFSIFWAFFHFSLSSSLDLGYLWPPVGIETISYFNLPFLNTMILITSGFFITWAHNAIKVENYDQTYEAMLWTICLAILFLIYQWTEYSIAHFNINDSVFGSVFYFGTGFHGLHVLLGTISIIYNFEKLVCGELSKFSHISLNFAIWYWHFVDAIWLFLFVVFYVWGQ